MRLIVFQLFTLKMKVKLLFCFLELILPVAIGQDNEPGLPSNMPAPPKDPTPAGGQGRRPGGPNGVANAALPGIHSN